jgi:hypothetical protein
MGHHRSKDIDRKYITMHLHQSSKSAYNLCGIHENDHSPLLLFLLSLKHYGNSHNSLHDRRSQRPTQVRIVVYSTIWNFLSALWMG